jgi:hypothetical protein
MNAKTTLEEEKNVRDQIAGQETQDKLDQMAGQLFVLFSSGKL